MAGLGKRLIEFVLRGRDELSPEAKKSAAALESLRQEADALGKVLDSAKDARGMVKSLESTQRAATQAERSLVQTDLQIRELRDALTKAPGSEGLQQSLKDSEREARRAQKALDELQAKLSDQEKAAKAAGIDTSKLSDEEKRLAAEVENAKQALAEHNRGLSELEKQQAAAARAAAQNATEVKNTGGAFTSTGKKILAFAAAYITLDAAIGLVKSGLGLVRDGIAAVFAEGSSGEQALGQLEAALASTGNAAGLTSAQLLEMASQLRDGSMFSTEEIVAAQTRLLSYTDVAGKEFPRAMQIIIDQSQRLGVGVEQSAEIVGKALQSPADAMTTLGRQGFKLADGQKQLIERLMATGKTAEAQAIIMDMLSEAYGGSAAAARLGTAAGLWKTLQDTIGDFAGTVADSGSFEYVKTKLGEVNDAIKQMASDGRLDALAKALSDAFVQGAGKVEEFAKKLLDVDFGKLTDDSAAWLNQFSEKVDSAVKWTAMLTAPFRVAGNVVTSFVSGVGVAFTGLVAVSLSAMGLLAKAVPDALGGQALVTGLESARNAVLDLMKGLAGQVAQDGRDIKDTWSSVAASAEASAERQAEAVVKATQKNKVAMQAAGDDFLSSFRTNIATLEGALAAISFAETAQELEQVEIGLLKSKLTAQELATAMDALAGKQGFVSVGKDLVNTADLAKSAVEALRKEQAELAKAYFAGQISLESWEAGHNKAAAAIRELGGETAKATATTKALGAELKTLADVQRAISDAKTDRDIATANAALKKMLSTGIIDGAQYNAEMKRSADRLKEIKTAIDGSKKAQDGKNDSDREAIKTSAQLRQESGKRMEEERRAGDQAMQERRKGAESAKADMSAMGDFFGGVMTRAREPLANMSAAALEAFDKLQGISTVDMSLDTGSLDETTASLEKATTALGQMQAAANTVGMSSLGTWMTTTAVRSQELQVQFLKQKASLQGLLEGYENGSIKLQDFVGDAQSARSSLNLLNDSDLRTLEGAIEGAKQKMQQLQDGSKATLATLAEELLGLRGEAEALERSKFAGRRADLQQQISDAQKAGDATALGNLQKAMGTLRQIEAETSQKRQQDEQQKRLAASKPAETAQPAGPAKIIRLETSKGKTVDVAVNGAADETNLLSILEDAGLRSL